MAKITKTIMVCDNPECSVSREHEEYEPAVGIFIDSVMVHHTGGGGEARKIYACSQKCVGRAISAVFDEAWDTGKVRRKW